MVVDPGAEPHIAQQPAFLVPDDVVRFPVVEDDIGGVEGFQSVQKVQHQLRHLLGRKSTIREQALKGRPLTMRPGQPGKIGPTPKIGECSYVGVLEGKKRPLETSDPLLVDIPVETDDKRKTSIVVSKKPLPVVGLQLFVQPVPEDEPLSFREKAILRVERLRPEPV